MAALTEQLRAMPLSPTMSAPPDAASSPFRLERDWQELVAGADAVDGGGEALVRSMSRRERARQEALWELIATELLIIRNLRLVNDVCPPFLPHSVTTTNIPLLKASVDQLPPRRARAQRATFIIRLPLIAATRQRAAGASRSSPLDSYFTMGVWATRRLEDSLVGASGSCVQKSILLQNFLN